MQTFPLNALAEQFEVDRSTMVRAMRHVVPDLVRRGNRPTWKTATAAKALEAHRRKTEGGGNDRVNTDLERLFAQLNKADDEMREINSLEGRRTFAKKTLLPLLHKVDQAMRADGRAHGEQEMLTDLRCDQHLRVFLVSGLGPDATGGCNWTPAECWDAYNPGYEDEEAA
jgi:hypothetical protein